MLHKLRVKSLGVPYAEVYLDDKKVKCHGLDVHMEAGQLPETTLELASDPDMEYESLITLDFTPKTYKTAVHVLKIGLAKKQLEAFLGINSLIAEMEKGK